MAADEDEEHADADHEGDVGDVEGRPDLALPVEDLDEVDHAVPHLAPDLHDPEQTIVQVAERTAGHHPDRDEGRAEAGG